MIATLTEHDDTILSLLEERSQGMTPYLVFLNIPSPIEEDC